MLELENIKFEYNNKKKKVIFDGLNFNIKDKELVSLIGPSGVGKTTLVKIIAGYLQPTQGKVFIQGHEKKRPDKNRIVINQENDLFDWMTVKKHLELVTSDKEKINRLIKLVGLEDYENYYPNKLSGGMKKRLSLARALAVNTDFIIMDEPFSSQDVQTKNRLHKELLEIAKKEEKTILLVTHDIEEAIFLSDRILVLGGKPAQIIGEHQVPFDKKNIKLEESSEFENLKNQLESLGYSI